MIIGPSWSEKGLFLGSFLGLFLGHFWAYFWGHFWAIFGPSRGPPAGAPRAPRARGRPGPRGPGGAPGRPGAPPARAGNFGRFLTDFCALYILFLYYRGYFWGSRGPPRGARPGAPRGGQKSVHFFGYLITLPVGTVWDTFSGRDSLGHPHFGAIFGGIFGVIFGAILGHRPKDVKTWVG